jgi:4-amino-4-deoxy-L-arabinose transferase-like glycosyltransferase
MVIDPLEIEEDDPKRRRIEIGVWAAVIVLAFLRFVYLGYGDLVDWDESLYVWRAKVVYFQNAWLDQSDLAWDGFYSAAFPPLQVWITAILFHLFGISEFTARLWPALTGAGSVVVAFLMGRRLGRSLWTGFFAAFFLASIWYYTLFSRRAQFDVPFTFFIALSLYGYVSYLDSLRTTGGRFVVADRQAWRWLVLSGAALGLGLMSKIVLALMAPIVAGGLGSYLWLRGRYPLRRLAVEQLVINGVALLIALPWHLAMILSVHGREFLNKYVWYHLLGRTAGTLDEHAGGWDYYFVALWKYLPRPLLGLAALAFVWFAVEIVRSFWKKDEGSDGWSEDEVDLERPFRRRDLRYLLPVLWLGFQLALFSYAQTKREPYTIPMYPAIALLAAMFLGERLRDVKRIGLLAVTLYVAIVLSILSRTKSLVRGLEAAVAQGSAFGTFGPYHLQLILLLAIVAVATLGLYLVLRARPRSFHRLALALIIGFLSVPLLNDVQDVFKPDKGKESGGWQAIRPHMDALDDYDYLVYCGQNTPAAMCYLNGLNLFPWHPRVKCVLMPKYDAALLGKFDATDEVRVVLMKSWIDEKWTIEEQRELMRRLAPLAGGEQFAAYQLRGK